MTLMGRNSKETKGSCFKCHEKYFVGHECVNKELRELRVMLVVNGWETELEEDGEGRVLATLK